MNAFFSVKLIYDHNANPIHGFDAEDKKRAKKQKEKDSLIDEVQMALYKEVRIFNRREKLISFLRVSCFGHM